MAKAKHIPVRTCVGCGEKKAKPELLRIVRGIDGGIFLDPSGKKSGRGAYICFNLNCLEKALKKKAIQRSLRVDNVDSSIIEELRKLITERGHGLEDGSGVCSKS